MTIIYQPNLDKHPSIETLMVEKESYDTNGMNTHSEIIIDNMSRDVYEQKIPHIEGTKNKIFFETINTSCSETYSGYPREEIPENASIPGNITIHGHFKNETNEPIRNETVLIFNSVPGPDILLEIAKTNSTGYLNITRHGPYSGMYNIYATIRNYYDSAYLRTNTVTNVTSGYIVELEVSDITLPECTPQEMNSTKLESSRSPDYYYAISGYCYYKDNNDLDASGNPRPKPIRKGLIEIWLDTWLGDYKACDTWTQDSGLYLVTVSYATGGNREFHATLVAENLACKVKDPEWFPGIIFDARYKQSTPSKVCPGGGIQLDDINGDHGCWNHMEQIEKMYEWFFVETQGWGRSAIDVWCPVYPAVHITGVLGEYINSGDPWDNIRIHHEYGHAIMYTAYGNDLPDSEVYHCSVADEKYESHAITEGWAHFVSCAIDNNANNLYLHIGKITNIEKNHWEKHVDKTELTGYPLDNFDGEIIEGCVASIFWDIFDDDTAIDCWDLDSNTQYPDGIDIIETDAPYEGDVVEPTVEDDLQMGIKPIFDILLWGKPYGTNEFWNDFFTYNNEQYATTYYRHWMKTIYYNHGIKRTDYPENPPTIGSMSPTGGFYSDGITITVTGIRDPDTEDQNYLHVKIGYYYDANGNGQADDAGSNWFLIDENTGSSGTRYAYWDTTSLSNDGHYLIKATVDDDMEENSVMHSIFVDNTDPTSSVSSLSTYQTSTSFTVSWNGSDSSPGSGLKWYDVQYKNGSSGTWSNWVTGVTYTSKTFTTGVNGHTYYFQCRATDNVGNVEDYPGGSGDTHTTIDTTPPSTTHSLLPATPDGNNGWYKSSPTVTLTSTDATSGVAYTKYKIGTGSWQTYTAPFSAPDGEYIIYYYSVDNAGKTESTKSFNIKVDTNAPTTTDNAPSGWQTTKPITVTLTTIDPSPGSGVAYTYYKKWLTTSSEPTTWTAGTTISLNSDDGKWCIKYYSVDNAGNSETPITKEVWIDTTAPSTPGTPIDAGIYSTSATITFTWTAATDSLSRIESYWLQVGTTSGGSDKFDDEVGNVLSYSVSNCEHGNTYYARVKAKNGAGLWGNWSGNSDGITVDLSIPSCSIHSIVEVTGTDYLYVNGTTLYYNPNYVSSFTIRVTASDTVSGLWKATGPSAFGYTPTDTIPSAGSYQFELTYTIESGATFSDTLTITVYDVAGNTNTCSITVVRDNTGPIITLGTLPIVESSEYLYAVGTAVGTTILYYSDLMGSTPQEFKIQGTASDSQAGLYYANASSAFGDSHSPDNTPANWVWWYSVVSTDNGDGQIVVTVYDNVNNYAIQTFGYCEDLNPPDTPPMLREPANTAIIYDRTPTFMWVAPLDYDDSGIAYYRLIVMNITNNNIELNISVNTGPYTPPRELNLSIGNHSWYVRAIDNVGNVGNCSAIWNFTIIRVFGVLLMPIYQVAVATAGSNVTFMITVTNAGNDYDTITLTTTSGTLNRSSVSLDYGMSTSITLTLTAPDAEGATVSAVVTGRSQGNNTKYYDVSCSVTSLSLPPPPPPPGIKRILPIQPGGVVDDGLIDGIHIGIGGHVDLPGRILDGDLDKLPGGRDDFCINRIIGVRPIFELPGFGLPGIFPHPWYCDVNNIYQLYYVNVSNPFDSTIIVNLSIYGVPEGWDAYLSDYSITLESGEYVIITLTVVIPKTTTIGQTTIWVLGTIQDYDYLFMYGVNVTVVQIPVPLIRVASPYTIVLENNVLVFNGSFSYDTDGTIFSYEWDFGDGTNGTGMAVEHSYENTGNYVVTLTVRDNYNLTNSTTVVVSVEHHFFEVSVQQINTEIMPGGTAVYMITVRNTGTISDTYVLRMNGLDSSWSYLDSIYLGISAGGSITLYLEVTIPSDYPLMKNTTYNFTITLSCMHDQTMMSNAPLTYAADETLTVIATKESKIRYMINEVEELMVMLDGMDIQDSVKNSLQSKLQGALDKLNTALDDILNGDENHADQMLKCAQNKLNAFINEVEAQRGKKITNEDADILVNAAQTIVAHINET